MKRQLNKIKEEYNAEEDKSVPPANWGGDRGFRRDIPSPTTPTPIEHSKPIEEFRGRELLQNDDAVVDRKDARDNEEDWADFS